MGADTVAAAFRQAIDDDRVRAILFRVDSPGGSYVASDTIWREIERAKQADKPVIVSMGSQAGSGGYYVAMGASKIVAQPGTITGSIGVYGGKLVTTGLFEKLGVSFDEVHTSDHGTFLSTTHDFSPGEWERLQAALDRIYEDFTGKVALGRTDLTPDEVEQVARGRIWTGEQALSKGLVDELGGFAVALRLAREEAGLDPDVPVRLREFPRTKTLWQAIRSRRPASSAHEGAAVQLARQTMESVRPLARLASQVGLVPLPGELTMPVAAPVW
jgi:protease-4